MEQAITALVQGLVEQGFPALVAGAACGGWWWSSRRNREEHRAEISAKEARIQELNDKLLAQSNDTAQQLFSALALLREASVQLTRGGRP
ncbi:hypothetical protein LCM17_21085 [Cereibacter sphaeroides]|nr:hypothetical protein [Cereibacter sphaeroides]